MAAPAAGTGLVEYPEGTQNREHDAIPFQEAGDSDGGGKLRVAPGPCSPHSTAAPSPIGGGEPPPTHATISPASAPSQHEDRELARVQERLAASSSDDVSDLRARMAQKDAELRELREKLAASEREASHLREMVTMVEVLDVDAGKSAWVHDCEAEPAAECVAKERNAGATKRLDFDGSARPNQIFCGQESVYLIC